MQNIIKGISFKGTLYGLSGKNTAIALIKLGGFPFRRFLRLGRRYFEYLQYWIYLFVPFAIICGATLIIAALTKTIGVNEIPSMAISITLGSFLLLVIKDIWDKETTRRKTLKRQLEVYNSSMRIIEQELRAVVEVYGVTLPREAFSPFSSEASSEAFNGLMLSSKLQASDLGRETTIRQCINLARDFSELNSEIDRFDFIGTGSGNLRINFQFAQEDIQTLSNSSAKDDIDSVRKSITGIVNSSFHIFACLRKPWRYPMDIKHNVSLEKWLNCKCLWSKEESNIPKLKII